MILPDWLIYAWILGSLGVAVFANSRGRNPIGWLGLSLITTPVVATILLLLMSDLALDAQRHEELLEALRSRDRVG